MASEGFKEVTLLGQTVSSYYERGTDFADLLRLVHAVDGIERVRFTSPYPNDFSPRLLDTLAALPKIGRHIHLPVQSGSTRVLKDMRRGYTEEAYRGLIEAVRRTLPDFALTTDIIVGYPGETEEDFEATLRLVQDVRYDGAFMFHYSEREGTRAARTRPDDVSAEVKGDRLKRLVAVQEEISRQRYAGMVGREIDVLVTGRSRKNEACLVGRSSCFKTTVLAPGPHEQGAMVRARVTDATSHTLFAEALL